MKHLTVALPGLGTLHASEEEVRALYHALHAQFHPEDDYARGLRAELSAARKERDEVSALLATLHAAAVPCASVGTEAQHRVLRGAIRAGEAMVHAYEDRVRREALYPETLEVER